MSEQKIAENLSGLLKYDLEIERVVFASFEGEDYRALSSIIHTSQTNEDLAYEEIQNALEAIELGGCDGADDDSYEIEGDVYNSDLIGWLGASMWNYAWCDGEMETFGGEYQSILDIIKDGQAAAKRHVWGAVIGLVRELAEEE